MALLRSLVVTHAVDDIPKDYDTCTVYHSVGANVADPFGGYDAQNHADEIRDAFRATSMYASRSVTVKVYDMADATPRPVKATSTVAGTDARGSIGPAEVALCLSFYSDRNLPHQRGRIYTGPFLSVETANGRPGAGLRANVLGLGDALFNIGGENVAHRVWSPTLNTSFVVHHYWVDDAWDTVRKRGLAATTRSKSDH